MPIKVPQKVYDGIEAVRKSGLTNMLDWPAVGHLCYKFGYPKAGAWVEHNKKEYSKGIFSGFEAEKESQDDRVSEEV